MINLYTSLTLCDFSRIWQFTTWNNLSLPCHRKLEFLLRLDDSYEGLHGSFVLFCFVFSACLFDHFFFFLNRWQKRRTGLPQLIIHQPFIENYTFKTATFPQLDLHNQLSKQHSWRPCFCTNPDCRHLLVKVLFFKMFYIRLTVFKILLHVSERSGKIHSFRNVCKMIKWFP